MTRLRIALLAACLLVAGCGDGGAAPTTTSDVAAPTTRAAGAAGDAVDAVDAVDASSVPTAALPQAAEPLDEVDETVPIGDCSSEAIGLAITTPDGWECVTLAQAVAGVDGFTLLNAGSDLNITLATPSPLGPPCELLGICGDAQPVELSENFPDTASVTFAGAVTIWGTHKSGAAEVVVTKASALTPEESSLVSAVLDSAVELQG
jgi:hypothetical protein